MAAVGIESVIPVVAAQLDLTGFSSSLEYLVELREYGPVYSTWSALEGELAEPLEGVSACVGNCSTALEELTDDMTEDFLPVLREYILYSDSMKVSWLTSFALRYLVVVIIKKVIDYCLFACGLGFLFPGWAGSDVGLTSWTYK